MPEQIRRTSPRVVAGILPIQNDTVATVSLLGMDRIGIAVHGVFGRFSFQNVKRTAAYHENWLVDAAFSIPGPKLVSRWMFSLRS